MVLPVVCEEPVVRIIDVYLAGDVLGDRLVMLRAERSRQFDLNRAERIEDVEHALTLLGELLVLLVREDDCLGLAVGAEDDWLRRRALGPETAEDFREPLPDVGKRLHMDKLGTRHNN
jgi:hypothetical protein